MTLYDMLEQAARTYHEQPAIVCKGVKTSYGEVLEGTKRAITALTQARARRRRIIMLAVKDPVEYIQYVLASMAIGCRVFPVTPSMGVNTFAYIAKQLKPCTIVTDSSLVRCTIIKPNEGAKPSEMLHLTSGSYGTQKIVVRSQNNLVSEAQAVAHHLSLDVGKKVCVMTPLAHSFGCGLWRAVMFAGATLYTFNEANINKRLMQIRGVLKYGVNFAFGVPTLFSLLAKEKMRFPTPIRCFAGGETLPIKTIDEWYFNTRNTLQQEYGLSEGGITTLANINSPSSSIGVPIPGVSLAIDDLESENNGIGELIVYRKYAPKGYFWGESPETFMEGSGIRTGDLVYEFEGEYYFSGRIKSVIIVAGMKVVPFEIEEALRKHPDVKEAVVIKIEDPIVGERPLAFVTLKAGILHDEGLRSFLKTELDTYKIPKNVNVLQKMPYTASGKVDRNALL